MSSLLLALDASGASSSAALLDRGALLAERSVESPGRSASALLRVVDKLLRESDRRLDEVDVIGLTVGPGSFTGLRVALATALGLCFGTPRRIAPVSTLAALSLLGKGAPRIAAVTDARKGEVYAGLYGPRAEPCLADALWAPLEFAERLAAEPGRVRLVGDGAVRYAEEFREVLGDAAHLSPATQGSPRAAHVGQLAFLLSEHGGAVVPSKVELRYLRIPDAERNRAAGHSRGELVP